jgi:hypothetical protein
MMSLMNSSTPAPDTTGKESHEQPWRSPTQATQLEDPVQILRFSDTPEDNVDQYGLNQYRTFVEGLIPDRTDMAQDSERTDVEGARKLFPEGQTSRTYVPLQDVVQRPGRKAK